MSGRATADSARWARTISKAGLAAVVLAGALGWCHAPEAFIADDSYFYLVIARNLALDGRQTFSGIVPTNGVHPLWQWLLGALAWAVARIDGSSALWDASYVCPLSLLLLSLGVWLWWRTTQALDLAALLVAGIPAAFLVAFGVLGSEAHTQYLCASLLAFLCATGRPAKSAPWALLSGVAAGLMVLARLDLIFLAASLSPFVIARKGSILRLGCYGLGGAILVAPYLASNRVLYGGLMPVSGWMKGSFPEAHFTGLHLKGIATDLSGYSIAFGIVPILVALSAVLTRGSEDRRARLLLLSFLAASVMHFVYVASFTRSHTGWYWYYVLPVTTGALGLAIWESRHPLRSRTGTALMSLVLLAIVVASAAVRPRRQAIPAQDAALEFVEALDLQGKAVLVSDWPGFLAFETTAKVVAADMLTSNRNFYGEMRQSPNALGFILDSHAREGAPIQAVLFLGNDWLVPNADASGVTFNDPRIYPRLHPIGQLTLGPPTLTSHEGRFLAWRLAPR